MITNKTRILMVTIAAVFCFFVFTGGILAATVNGNGTYESKIYSSGQASTWGTMTWASTDADATVVLTVKVRSCDDSACSGETAFSSCTAVASSGTDISSNGCVTDGDQWVQYEVNLSKNFDDTTSGANPTLDSVVVNYSYYTAGASTLTGSKYSASSGNAMGGVSWEQDETLPSGSEVAIYLRTASLEGGLTGAWTGIATSTASVQDPPQTGCSRGTPSGGRVTITCDITSIPSGMKDGTGDDWYQYLIKLVSDGTGTPTVDNVDITYIVNAPPEFDATFGTNGVTASQNSSTGDVDISYKVRDEDTESPYTVTPSFEYYNGSSWANITAGLSAGATDAKSVNSDGVTYTTHSLTWTPHDQVDGTYTAGAQIRVTVNDGQLANNTANATGAVFTMDAKDPVPGTNPIIINATSTPALITLDATDDTALEMKVGLASDLSDASWESYSVTKNLSLATDPDTVYAQFKDAYNNTSSIVNYASIETPSNTMIQDTSNVPASEYRLFIAWQTAAEPTAGFNEYRVLRSTDNVTYSILTTIPTRTTNYYGDNSVSFDTIYYYKIVLVDDNGNTSYLTSALNGKANGTQDAGEGGGGTETTAPVISNVTIPSATIYTTEATVLWDTTELSDSTVKYITSTGGDFSAAPTQGVSSFVDTAAGVGQHSVTLTGLSPATTYYLQIQSIDPSSNTATSTQGVDGYTFTTDSGPQITADPEYIDLENTSVTINWPTNILSNSYVVYSTNSDMSSSSEVGQSDSVTAHSVDLTGLSVGQKYYYYIKSGTAARKNTVSGTNLYYTFTTTSDVTAPTISSVAAAEKRTSALITWTTDELATSTVEYGLTDSYGSTASSDTFTRKHSIELTSLDPNTTYHYQVISADGSNNYATSTGHTFTTEEFKTSDVTSATVSETSNTVTWSTNESATSQVEYSTSSALVGSSLYPSTPTAAAISHSITLSGLDESTTYYYRASSTASGVTINSPIHYFTTGDTTAPEISSVTVPLYTDDSATVSWNTDELADGLVKYGTTSITDPTTSDYDSVTTLNETLTRIHSASLTSLTDGTTYYYRVISADSNSNKATSTEGTFDTLTTQIGHPDLTDPGAPTVTQYSDTEAVISLTTNTTATSKLCYDTSTITVAVDDCPAANLSTITSATRTHSFHLSDLSVSTTYYVKVKTTDSESGAITFTSDEITFETLGTQVAQATLTCPPCVGGGGATKVCPRVDKTKPVISDLSIFELGPESAKISWTTNESANELITYGFIPDLDTSYHAIRGNESEFDMSHLVSLANLDPSTTYFYRAASRDKAGNLAKSAAFSFTTPSRAEGIVREIEKVTEEVEKEEIREREEAEGLLTASLDRVNEIIKKFSGIISVGTLETSVKESVENIESLIPSPIIQGEPRIEIEENKVTIKWLTDKEANSIVLFVDEDKYDPATETPYLYQTGDAGRFTREHSVTIPNLLADTTYHYQIASKAVVGPQAKSGNLTFITEREVPKVTFSQIQDITDFTASIIWTTNLPTDSLIKYTPYDEEGEVYIEEESQIQGKAELVKNHLLTIENLDPGTTYSLEIQGKDEFGGSFTYYLGELNTSRDVRAPQITNIKTESSLFPTQKERVQTIITWNTDEDATSQIAYIESGKSDGLTDENIIKAIKDSRDPEINKQDPTAAEFSSPSSNITLTKFNSTMTKKQINVITSFKPNTVYKFRVISVDPSGNVALSDKFVTLTPQQTETVLEMVIKTFEERFKWLQGVGGR